MTCPSTAHTNRLQIHCVGDLRPQHHQMAHEEAPDYFSTTFSIEDEDHTLANSLRFFLNKKWVCCAAFRGGRSTVSGRPPIQPALPPHRAVVCPLCLLRSPHVALCGYSMPHPSEELVNMRVQTTGGRGGEGAGGWGGSW